MITRNLMQMLMLVLVLLLTSYNSGGSDLQVNETDTETIITQETIHMNNCGGKADSEQVAQRSQTISVGGEIKVSGGYAVVEASVTAKYFNTKGVTKSQRLIAPPGTNMEFVLGWTEQSWIGVVTTQGKSGQATYRVNVPIAVELISSRDLGCNGATTTEEVRNTSEITVDILANQNWQNTGVSVQPGDTLVIQHISGKWSPWSDGSCDGNGMPNTSLTANNIVTGVLHASLIGRIGDNQPFFVGNTLTQVVEQSGYVYLRINDTALNDNSGKITLRIQITR